MLTHSPVITLGSASTFSSSPASYGNGMKAPRCKHFSADAIRYRSAANTALKRTYDVEGEVAVAADVSGCVLGTAVVQAIVVWSGALEGERSLLVVDLVALLRQLHAILKPLARWPERERHRGIGQITRERQDKIGEKSEKA